jgi:membrane protein DedA with SNARE-associated domain
LSYIDAIVAWVHAHPHYAFAAVFLLAFVESLPVGGSFVPGASAIVAIAAILPKDAESLLPALLAAIAGASLGDGFSFWLGHRYQRGVLSHWPLKNYPGLVRRGEMFIEEHGVKSIVLARFTPPVRALVPLLTGIFEMPVHRYVAGNIVAATLWAVAHVGFGAFVGHSLALFEHKYHRYLVLAAAILAVLALGYVVARRLSPPVRQK